MNKKYTMKGFIKASAVCSASLLIFSLYSKAAVEPVLPAIKAPIQAAAVNPAENIQTQPDGDGTQNSQLDILSPDAAIGHTEFDEFSSVNDPLYREGSKALLQKAIEEDKAPKAAVKKTPGKKELWRDAPADMPAKAAQPAQLKGVDKAKNPVFPVKKNRLIKLIPADPVETKSTL